VYSSHSVIRATNGVATTTEGAAGAVVAAVERHPLTLALASATNQINDRGEQTRRAAVVSDAMGIELHIKAAPVPGGDVLADGEAQPEVATIAARGHGIVNHQRDVSLASASRWLQRTCWRANQQEETSHER
jgi:hypothetical protein